MALVMEDKESLEKMSLAAEHGSTEPEIKSRRERLAEILKCNLVQYSIISLVVLDSVIVLLEFLIDLDMIHRTITTGTTCGADDAHSSGTPDITFGFFEVPEDDVSGSHSAALNHSWGEYSQIVTTSHPGEGHSTGHPQSDHSSHGVSRSPDNHISPGHNVSSLGHNDTSLGHRHHHSNKELAEHVLHYASLTILSIFVVEVVTKIYAEGTHLLKHKAEVFDAIVVLVSFTLDIIFSFVNVTDAARDAAGLMIILRLWRITRIINGVIISVKMDADKKIEEQKVARSKAEEEVERLKNQVMALEEELAQLQEQLRTIEEGKAVPDLDVT